MNGLDLKYFRLIALLEGLSLLILMFIAVPMKRLMGYPEATKVIGMIHGILFLMYCYSLFTVSRSEKWPTKKAIIAFITASVPFGTFWFDKKYLAKT